jgi:hypothetical protein
VRGKGCACFRLGGLRPADHGATFSHPQRLSTGPAFWSDVWRSLGSERRGSDAIWIAASRDQGRIFGAPRLVAEIMPFDSNQFSGNGAPECGDFQFRCPTGLTFAEATNSVATIVTLRGPAGR